MKTFVVNTTLKLQGKIYTEGSTVELSDRDVAKLGEYVSPATPSSAAPATPPPAAPSASEGDTLSDAPATDDSGSTESASKKKAK